MMGVDIATEISSISCWGQDVAGPPQSHLQRRQREKTCRWKFSCRLYTFQR
jgi:hypothetical protein